MTRMCKRICEVSDEGVRKTGVEGREGIRDGSGAALREF